jgi:hypothetical protein
MRAKLPIAVLAAVAAVAIAGCASTPVRDFQADYQRTSTQSVKIDGYPPFRVAELREQRRLKVELNVLAQAFGSLGNPLVLLGVSSGIPPESAHRSAALVYLAESGRAACSLVDGAVSPSGREFEFRYACQDG